MFMLANHVQVNNEQKNQFTVTDEARRELQAFWIKYANNRLVGMSPPPSGALAFRTVLKCLPRRA